MKWQDHHSHNKIAFADPAAAPLVLHDDLRHHGQWSRHSAPGPSPCQERPSAASPASAAHPSSPEASSQNIRDAGQ